MNRVVTLPPPGEWLPDGARAGGWWHATGQGSQVVCDLCPRECHLKDGDRGFCFVRENRGGQMVLTTYGRSTGFCVDPIEKKPLNHFFPGTSVLSFGTAGCNLGCKFCQNWDISKSREVERLSERATPQAIAQAARQLGCRSVAYTYNDPIIWAEYAMDCARACRELGVKSVAVTAGYISPGAREAFFREMDAANVDLKAFTEDFYHKITYSHLQPVLDTLEWLQRETDVWFEITNLIIPRANDGADELRRMCDWILEHVGDEVPVHFTAFHPDFRMKDRPATPPETLLEAYALARRQGVKYVYVGNVHDKQHQSTYCPECRRLLIERDWHALGQYHLEHDTCAHCGTRIAGHFDPSPGNWGRRRLPVRISEYAPPADNPPSTQRESKRETTMASSPSSGPASGPTSGNVSSSEVQAPPELTDDQRQAIQLAACEVMAAAITGTAPQLPDKTLCGAADLTVMGAFVTAKRQGRLRGCCGWLGRPMSLLQALQNSAARTATEDSRFPPITLEELPYLDIDVTLLAGFQNVRAEGRDRIAAVEIGKHGLQVQRGDRSGLLLPVVAVEHGMDAEEFLRQVCRKAGLPSNAWEDSATRLVTFLGLAVHGPFDSRIAERYAPRGSRFSKDDLDRLARHAGENILRLVAGATPSYYLPEVSDATVPGVILSLTLPSTGAKVHLARIVVRPGVPLQATLFQLAEAAARHLAQATSGRRFSGELRIGVAILDQPSLHGTVAEPDLRGIDPRRQVVAVSEAGRSAWAFDPATDAGTLVERAAGEAQVLSPEAAAITTFTVATNETQFCFGNAPRPQTGRDARPPAVAGQFYPGDANQLKTMVDEFLAEVEGPAESWPAAMVPHAGLMYSGRIAAAVLKRLVFPETVIIIGPKHTRNGLPWAVAPHEAWNLPGWNLKGNLELARRLVDAVPEFELDAAAHQQEHAIEVELPFVARLAPECRVVGITIGAGDLDRCRRIGHALASVLRELPEPPLLLISSDMNHFATDAENRRLDAMALEAMESLDPERLYDTVRRHDISMCGVLPAVMVMEALRQLGKLHRSERVAYGTSADVSGDTRRVVGYAGMLLG